VRGVGGGRGVGGWVGGWAAVPEGKGCRTPASSELWFLNVVCIMAAGHDHQQQSTLWHSMTYLSSTCHQQHCWRVEDPETVPACCLLLSGPFPLSPQTALIDFENVSSMEPRNYVGDNFSRVTPIYKVTLYNIACCYSMLNQVRGVEEWGLAGQIVCGDMWHLICCADGVVWGVRGGQTSRGHRAAAICVVCVMMVWVSSSCWMVAAAGGGVLDAAMWHQGAGQGGGVVTTQHPSWVAPTCRSCLPSVTRQGCMWVPTSWDGVSHLSGKAGLCSW
jgi:hypothetical protein